jgi:Zn-dependent protease
MLDPAFIAALLLAVTVHEFSHAWVAHYFGDPTAKMAGRVTLNPLAHLDFFGTLMLLLIGFGWGKPVPVNPLYLSHPKRDAALVSLAGPASNILLAIAVALPYKYLVMQGASAELQHFFRAIFDLNLLLAIFNFIPLPPLDGSKMIGIFIPSRYYRQYQYFLVDGIKYFIAFILIDSFVLQDMFGISILSWFLMWGYDLLSTVILLGT